MAATASGVKRGDVSATVEGGNPVQGLFHWKKTGLKTPVCYSGSNRRRHSCHQGVADKLPEGEATLHIFTSNFHCH